MAIDNISTPKDEVLYAKQETTFGTVEYPAGTDFIPIVTEAVFKQPQTFLDDPQKKLTVSQTAKIAAGYQPGEFNLTMAIKPSGALGTPIKGAQLLKGLFGEQTTTPATSDVFTLAGMNDDILGFTFVHRFGHRVTWNLGCVINKATFPIKANDAVEALGQVQLSGQFCKQIQAGYTAVNNALGYAATDTDIVVDDERSFEAGAKIRFRNATTGAVIDDNAGAGFTIASVTAATHTITLATGLINAVADDSVVDGFVPTASDAGDFVFGRLGKAQECESGGTPADLVIVDAQVEFENNFKIKAEEKTGTLYPLTPIRAGNRMVTYTCNKVFYKGEANYYAESKAQTQKQIKLPVGDTAASRYRIEMPYVVFETPELSAGDEIGIGRKGTAIASSSYDDEITLTFD